MRRLAPFVALFALCVVSGPLWASEEPTLERAVVQRVTATQGTSYSAEIPVVARIQGTAFFRTSVDINNNLTQNTVSVQYQFSYTCTSSGCDASNPFHRTAVQTLSLAPLHGFHQDDFVDFLNSQSLLVPGAEQGCFGTLLLIFDNVPVDCPPLGPCGWELAVVARTYNHLDENTADSATVGFAYNASLFFESADTTVVGLARDTEGTPGLAGKLRSNIGIRNTDINNTTQNVSLVLTAYDVTTGQKVGDAAGFAFNDLRPGEVRQISNLWNTLHIPLTVHQVIVFIDNLAPTSTSPTFEGYVTIVDGGAGSSGPTSGIATQDASFFEMKCTDANGCDN
jgi:hypothetical protein